jgi:hypothetical protein
MSAHNVRVIWKAFRHLHFPPPAILLEVLGDGEEASGGLNTAATCPTVRGSGRRADVRQAERLCRHEGHLTPDEAEKLMAGAGRLGRHGHRDATLILLAYRHGLRVSELVAPRSEQIDLKLGLLHQGEDRDVSGDRPHVHVDGLVCRERQDEGRGRRLEAREISLGGNLNGDWYVQRQWCLIAGFDNPYPEMYDHPEIIKSYDK